MLNHDDVQEILQLLDGTGYRQLKLETDSFTLILQRESTTWTVEQEVTTQPEIESNIIRFNEAVIPSEATVSHEHDHLHAVHTPLPGTFYRAPKPGAAAFVEVGSRVEFDTQVCIIETMKLMNAVYAGVSGIVLEICGNDGEFVDKDSVILLIDPESNPA